MEGATQAVVAVGLIVASVVCSFLALRSGGPGEFWWVLASTAITAVTLVIQRARVLTIPFFFVLLIVLLFWSARRAAERKDAEEER